MKISRIAAAAVAVFCLVASTDALARMHGGHAGGAMPSGGTHVAPHGHGGHPGSFRHDGFRHDGRHFHGAQLASSFIILGGAWYPWYSYPAPVYASGGYAYYCQSAAAYYPVVTACAEPWVLVPM